MSTIDLSTPPPPSAGLLDALPRRVTLTLPELRLVAARAGGAPLPFDPPDPVAPSGLEERLGGTHRATEHEAYAAALAGLRDPETTLARRGLLGDLGVEQALLGAVGLLATPTTALDLDVTAAGGHARSWHRQAGHAVATLSTADGIVFELAWFPTSQWAAELGRVPILPEDLRVRASAVPAQVEIPFELADAALEAVRRDRADLVPVLVARHDGAVLGPGGPLPDREVAALLTALGRETRGRLRVLAADVTGGEPSVVGVVSWALLADGWHALRPRQVGDVHRVVVSAVEPSDLARELAPVLAEVTA